MSKLQILKNLSLIDRFMLGACILYVIAFLFLTQSVQFGVIEYIVLGLTLISISLLIGKVLTEFVYKYSVYVEIAELVIAGFISVRYLLAFVTDLNHFVTLLLFIAAVGFATVLVLSIKQFINTIVHMNSARSNSVVNHSDGDINTNGGAASDSP